ncbi:MAG: amidohydrolase family protein, partial [Gemmatimonadota bacterium]
MHVHVTDATEIALSALVAHGVTGVRDMGGDLALIDRWRKEIRSGDRVGPRIVRPGPYVDGHKPDAPFRFEIADSTEARAAVMELVGRGVDFIKLHNAVPRDAYFALAEAARDEGIPFAGHVPVTVEPIEAIRAGQASLEHAITFFEGTFAAGFSSTGAMLTALTEFVDDGGAELIDALARHRTHVTPTLVATERRGRRAPLADDPPMCQRYVAASLRDQWNLFSPVQEADRNPSVVEARQRMTELMVRFTGRLREAAVPVLAGSDLAARDVCPGTSLHEELEMLVDAGLTPLEALSAATTTPARFLGLEQEIGTIEPGKWADLVVLDGDPLADISNVGRVHAVVMRGQLLDRDQLDELLEGVAELAPNR